MEIEVSIQGKHKLTVSTPMPGREPFVATDRSLNLSEESICTHPFEPRNSPERSPLFLNLQEKTHELFRLLSFASSSSPLVAQLAHYYEHELGSILQQIAKPQSRPYQDIREKVTSLSKDHTRLATCYQRIIQRIIHEIPDFFTIERRLGILPFLESLNPKDLPFRISTDAGLHKSGDLIPHDALHGEGVLFFSRTNMVCNRHSQFPTAEELIISLAACGMTNGGVNLLNKTAALAKIHQAIPNGIALKTSSLHEEESSLKNYIRTSLINGAVASLSLPLLYAAGTLLTEGSILAATTSACVGMSVGLLAGFSQVAARAIRRKDTISDAPVWLSKQAKEFSLHSENPSLSLLSRVLFHTLSCRGSSREMTPIDKQQTNAWYLTVEKFRDITPFKLPREEHDSIVECLRNQDTVFSCEKVPFQISDLESQCAHDLLSKLLQELCHIEHVKTAEHTWQIIQAIESVVSFTNRGIAHHTESEFFSFIDLLPRLRDSQTSQNTDVHRDLQRVFNEMLAFHAIDLETWAFIAQPLLAVDIIEQNRKSRLVADVATEELFRE